jgi:hypothetical protein
MVNQRAPSFAGAVEYVNSKPVTLAELHGKVVLVDFWTYTCVNWRDANGNGTAGASTHINSSGNARLSLTGSSKSSFSTRVSRR